MFKNNKFPTLYAQSYGRDIQVSNYSNSYTLPHFKLLLNSSCTDTLAARNIRSQGDNTNLVYINQNLSQHIDCEIVKNRNKYVHNKTGNVQCSKIDKIQKWNVNAPVFYPGNVRYCSKSGCNILARVFLPKNCGNGIKTKTSVLHNKSKMSCNMGNFTDYGKLL